MADRIGSIEVGKEGDIAIFKNHPLSIYTIPQMTIVDGVVYFDINQDADDMRMDLAVDPVKVEGAYYDNYDSKDKCMEGVDMLKEFKQSNY